MPTAPRKGPSTAVHGGRRRVHRLAAGLLLCAGFVPQGGEEVGKAYYQRHLVFRAQNQLDKAALELELAVKAGPQMCITPTTSSA